MSFFWQQALNGDAQQPPNGEQQQSQQGQQGQWDYISLGGQQQPTYNWGQPANQSQSDPYSAAAFSGYQQQNGQQQQYNQYQQAPQQQSQWEQQAPKQQQPQQPAQNVADMKHQAQQQYTQSLHQSAPIQSTPLLPKIEPIQQNQNSNGAAPNGYHQESVEQVQEQQNGNGYYGGYTQEQYEQYYAHQAQAQQAQKAAQPVQDYQQQQQQYYQNSSLHEGTPAYDAAYAQQQHDYYQQQQAYYQQQQQQEAAVAVQHQQTRHTQPEVEAVVEAPPTEATPIENGHGYENGTEAVEDGWGNEGWDEESKEQSAPVESVAESACESTHTVSQTRSEPVMYEQCDASREPSTCPPESEPSVERELTPAPVVEDVTVPPPVDIPAAAPAPIEVPVEVFVPVEEEPSESFTPAPETLVEAPVREQEEWGWGEEERQVIEELDQAVHEPASAPVEEKEESAKAATPEPEEVNVEEAGEEVEKVETTPVEETPTPVVFAPPPPVVFKSEEFEEDKPEEEQQLPTKQHSLSPALHPHAIKEESESEALSACVSPVVVEEQPHTLAPPTSSPDQALTPDMADTTGPQFTSTPKDSEAESVKAAPHQPRRGSNASAKGTSSSSKKDVKKEEKKAAAAAAEPVPEMASSELSDSSRAGGAADRDRGNVRERMKAYKQQYNEIFNRLAVARHTDAPGHGGQGGQHNRSLNGPRTPNRHANPLMMEHAANGGSWGRRSVNLGRLNHNSTPKDSDVSMMRAEMSSIHLGDKNDTMDMSLDVSRGYGDDFVDAARRSRLSRSRPASRAKSEIGEPYRDPRMGMPPHARQSMFEQHGYPMPYGYGGMAPSGRYPHPHHAGYPAGRYSSMGAPYAMDYFQQQQQQAHAMQYDQMRRRPQSSFDAGAHARFQQAGGAYGAYDAYAHEQDGSSEESDEDEEESEEVDGEEQMEGSEAEMRRYHQAARMQQQQQKMYGGVGAMPMPGGFPGVPVPSSDDNYYFGVIQLDRDRVASIMHSLPPPPEYYGLAAIEKAAYLFYAAIHKRHFQPVEVFHKRFNREFFKFTADNDSSDLALWKICKSIQEEYNAKRISTHQKAYEASQRQLFSDERDGSPDSSDEDEEEEEEFDLGEQPRQPHKRRILRTKSDSHLLSDRASLYEQPDASDADVRSIDSTQKAPLKHRVPHAFTVFGPGGRMVTVQPDKSVSVVYLEEVRSKMRDEQTRRIIDAAETFHGPLVAGQTRPQSVRLYVQRQMERIRQSGVYRENPHDADVVDAMLVWQLLDMVVQQQGRVNGPDVAGLLIAAGGSAPLAIKKELHPHHREKSATPSLSDASMAAGRRSPAVHDPRAYERFTQFLLGGHVDEAVTSAIRDGLFADALVLARRVLAHDPNKLAEVEERFLATRPSSNPVMTLLAVASNESAPILTNPPSDDAGSWRTHAAIVLANLDSPKAMQTVYDLGRVLAKRDYHSAADFCMLAVALLAKIDPFQPVQAGEEDASVRQHISLIHASLPDDDVDSTTCRYGFSLADLHATEIFDYAVRLAEGTSQLACSVDYQRRRLQYAKLLTEYGGFAKDAFRYCMEIARAVWNYYHLLTAQELTELCDMADKLRFVALVDESETAWIDSLRSMIAAMPQSSGEAEAVYQQQHYQHQPAQVEHVQQEEVAQQQDYQQEAVQQQQQQYQQHQQVFQPEPTPEPAMSRPRASSVESVSASVPVSHTQPPVHQEWQQQPEPVPQYEMPSIPSMPTPSPMPPQQRERSESNASRASHLGGGGGGGGMTFGEQLCSVQQQYYGQHEEATEASSSSRTETGETSTVGESSSSSGGSGGSSSAEQTPRHRPSHDLSSIPEMPSMPSMPPMGAMPSVPSMPTPAPAPVAAPAPAPAPMQNGTAKQFEQKPKPQEQPATASAKQSGKGGAPGGGGGFFAGIKNRIAKAIPTGNEMILPDDSAPSIHWDPVLKKYVGAGVEEETVAAPPPMMEMSAVPAGGGGAGGGPPAGPAMGGGLRAARAAGGSRYFNPLTGNGSANAPAAPSMPMMPVPTTFSFIPTMPDDAESVDPFSQTDPNLPTGQAQEAQ